MDELWISLPVAAFRLAWSWPKAYNAALTQQLEARRSPQGRWLVSAASVDRVLRERGGSAVTEMIVP
jgi:hypothetical protein